MRTRYRDSIEHDLQELERANDLDSLKYLVHHARLYLNLGNLSSARKLISDINAVRKEQGE